jgi:hypothetical protein
VKAINESDVDLAKRLIIHYGLVDNIKDNFEEVF